MPNAYMLGAIKLGSEVITGSANAQLNTGISKSNFQADGAIGPRSTYINAMDPGATFNSANFKLLAQIGLARPVTQAEGGVTFYLEKMEPNAAIYEGNQHSTMQFLTGMLYPTRLAVPTEGVAMIDYVLACSSPGQTWPGTWTDSVALPALSMIPIFGMGPTMINNILVDTKSQLTIDFNPNVAPWRRDGKIYPDCHFITGVQPRTTLTLDDATFFNQLGRSGPVNAATTAFYFRRRMEGGEYYPDDEAVHVKMTFSGDLAFEQIAGGASNELSNTTMIIDHLSLTSPNANPVAFETDVIVPEP